MSIVNRALMSSESGEALSESISEARRLTGSSGPGSASPPVAARELPAGVRWGPLEVLEHVGAGAFGDVYRARDPRLDREVALKILRRDSDATGEVVREARLLAAARHPNVVTVHGADRIDGQVGIWTEFLHGRTLEQILGERGPLDAVEAARIGIDVSAALSAAHAAGIVHQDVKLANVIHADDGRIVLMDFGLGGEIEPIRPTERRLSGTPLFMAPEVLRGDRADARSDLYSLGVVLFSLVTGSPPVEASSLDQLRAKHAAGERRQARDLRPELPAAFLRVLDRALAPDPGERYQTAGEAERGLRECLGALVTTGADAVPDARATVPHRLPAESDAFIGRDAELAELARRFQRGARLVTLLGPAGIGKTRLAVHFAWNHLEEWPGGVWFCDLSETRTRDDVVATVAETLGERLTATDAVEQLGGAIGRRGRCLVILDNVEQVVDEARHVVLAWLAAAPEARILVTSREPLRFWDEQTQAIEALPTQHGVELFVERAQRQRPIDREGPEAASVRQVVKLLEGIPLAIELATGRLRVMTPTQMLDRITERFRLLASGGVGRHATLRAAIDGSWELLKPWEQAAFAQCSVFEGGFVLDAAEAVWDLDAWPDAPWTVDVLQSLVDKNLLRSWVPASGTGVESLAQEPAIRFGMFASLHEYAREKLAEEGAIPAGGSGVAAARAAERRHARWYAGLGSTLAPADHERVRVLLPEIDNLVAACRRMVTRGEGETAVWAFRSACVVFDFRGSLTLGIELGAQVLAAPLMPDKRALTLRFLAQQEQRFGRVAAARGHMEESLAIVRDLGDRRAEGISLEMLASLSIYEGRLDEAVALFEAAIEIRRETGDRLYEAICLGNLGLALQAQGRLEEASARMEAAYDISRERGDRKAEGVNLSNLADLRAEQGRNAEALDLFHAALEINREVGNRRFEGSALTNLGILCRKLGRWQEARAHLETALIIHRETGNRRFEGVTLEALANLALAQGVPGEARAQFHAALAIHREVGDRFSEGSVLGSLGALHLDENRIEEARDLLAKGAELLRSTNGRAELAKLLCTRAELEHRTGAAAAAQATLSEAEDLAARIGAGAESDVGRRLAQVRAELGPPGSSLP